ncbi:MAG: D-alanyl-D-alanine carboxypeptidase/D-alanyl-D-alanine-endopeptidase [Bacteroidaceae bacterium]|nr:D-alanyl-D-alanine carboxypeptidase/D-alanyl-D-alanine-endopeptidase [Bacteroidaceae bacterium]MBQ4056549.1 D-alanyl-D-alanine carboxypeptidase/D-alanyl-D-alanine-endopeptidase [Bacteroidaceae bacterium]MBR6621019.1 D-alanyl-D-alanine carboxypeptidase/D-alanyl-D-alanine-endopeptidase [Bacteroides sp.]
MKKLFLLLGLIISSHILYAQSLAQRLDSLLNNPLLKTSEVGITVFDLTEGKSLYRYQDENLYRPASTEKVITSVTALAQLGTTYTMDTQLQYTGTIENDTLKGNLYLIGGFDPEFMEADLDSLVDAVAQSGIRYISDTLVADVSMMDSIYWGPGWSWDDVPNSFQPYLSPLMLNRGCVDVTVTPTIKDSLPQITCSPTSDYYQVSNQAISRNPMVSKLKITRNWLHGGNQIQVSGNVSRTTTETLSIYDSKAFFFHTFTSRLKERGITISATAYADCPIPNDSLTVTPLYVHRRPISQVLKQALKESDNLCAEAMFHHLAKQYAFHNRVSFEDGTDAINDFMKKNLGFNPEHYRIADGSGVSLYNYVSPRLLLEYLKYAYYHPDIFHPFYESLPIAGIDGTLQYRMKKTPAYRKVHAKTGSVTGVSSLAGYAKAANGHQLAFVIINQNVMKLRQARAFQDRICQLLCQ